MLETTGGVEDLLLGDLLRLPEARVTVERRRPNPVVRYRGEVGRLAELRLYSTCSVVLGRPSPAGAIPRDTVALHAAIARSLDAGLLKLAAPDGQAVRFRVGPLRGERWQLRDELVARRGWVNDPSDWSLNLEIRDGHLVAQVGALHYSRRFGPLERLPASTTPVLAFALARLLDARPGQLVYDPCCGAATILGAVLETAAAASVLGGDISRRALRAARRNLRRTAARGRWALVRADARRLPVRDGAAARVVANLPFGKRVASHQSNVDLYPVFAAELARVLAPSGRAVLLTEEKELLRRSVGATRELRIEREHLFASGGLHPTAFVLAKR
jgi:SAM-dependent methyltransferase